MPLLSFLVPFLLLLAHIAQLLESSTLTGLTEGLRLGFVLITRTLFNLSNVFVYIYFSRVLATSQYTLYPLISDP